MSRLLPLLLFLCTAALASAQTSCEGRLGLTPAAAYEVCNNGTVSIPPAPNCWNGSFFLQGCTNQNTSYGDTNPVYFRFTVRTSGSFGFFASPRLPENDLNWQLFDITNKQPNDIFTDNTLTVAANWSGTLGSTGASPTGQRLIQCRTLQTDGTINPFSPLIQVQAGRTYLLMVSALTGAGDFAITFNGGTAVLGDAAIPGFEASATTCNTTALTVQLSKSINCSSISSDGSEFSFSPAIGFLPPRASSCTSGTTTNQLRFVFTQPVAAGNYTLTINSGTDGNTLVDNCGNALPTNTIIRFRIADFPLPDTVTATVCTPSVLRLKMSNPVSCNSIAPDGSDFRISGPSAVSIVAANRLCSNGETTTIKLQLGEPIRQGGTYRLHIQNGTDGNTLTDGCNRSTPPGTQQQFEIIPPADARFTWRLAEGCTMDTLYLQHPGTNNVTKWNWVVNNQPKQEQNPVYLLSRAGRYTISLTVQNIVCSDTTSQDIQVAEKLNAAFDVPATACAGDQIQIVNNSTAATAFSWNFGNGVTSTAQQPAPITFNPTTSSQSYRIQLTASNNRCSSSLIKEVTVFSNCNIFVPNAFTPNGDGLNDVFGPANTAAAEQWQLEVYNRYGQRIFQSSAGSPGWNGGFGGILQPAGQYTWILRYKERRTGKQQVRRGTVLLLY